MMSQICLLLYRDIPTDNDNDNESFILTCELISSLFVIQ